LKERTGQEVKSVDLKNVRNNTYEGTARFANGEVWDIHATVSGGSGPVAGDAAAVGDGAALSAKMLRQQLKVEPKAVAISKGPNGMYSGNG